MNSHYMLRVCLALQPNTTKTKNNYGFSHTGEVYVSFLTNCQVKKVDDYYTHFEMTFEPPLHTCTLYMILSLKKYHRIECSSSKKKKQTTSLFDLEFIKAKKIMTIYLEINGNEAYIFNLDENMIFCCDGLILNKLMKKNSNKNKKITSITNELYTGYYNETSLHSYIHIIKLIKNVRLYNDHYISHEKKNNYVNNFGQYSKHHRRGFSFSRVPDVKLPSRTNCNVLYFNYCLNYISLLLKVRTRRIRITTNWTHKLGFRYGYKKKYRHESNRCSKCLHKNGLSLNKIKS
ncbi:hypothetical protein AGLY_008659 [Aphis glycines]|uniref:Uncharacterized protein n=1 Tax=Aphis glycines TaxID=307491 RepID=A0A6G0TMW6_APHGL|nr:hypothetical protein AGLY_008659 [Aphis glycines]